jgi:hypothetical protein
MKKLFISYYYQDVNGDQGHGNSLLDYPEKIIDSGALLEISRSIDHDNIVIINWRRME